MKLNLTAPINKLGYGVVGNNIYLKLLNKNIDVSWWPIGSTEIDNTTKYPLYQQGIDKQASYDAKAPSLRIWHQHDLAQHVGRGLHCGFPIFELDTLRPPEQHHLSQQDVVFVASEWAKKIVLQYEGISGKIEVAPLGIDTSIFQPSTTVKPDPSWTTFLNCGKWEVRKGHDVLVEAFSKAFEPKDRVRLWMLTDNPFIGVDGNREWEKLYGDSKMGGHISFLPRIPSHGGVATLMQESDCGVFPSRAEGWNLEALEMMACEREIIITNYSGHTEFADKTNSYLIDVDEKEEAFDGKWFFGKEKGFGNWAHFGDDQMEQLVNNLSYVHQLKQEAGVIKNIAGSASAKRFTWTNTVECILKGMGVTNHG